MDKAIAGHVVLGLIALFLVLLCLSVVELVRFDTVVVAVRAAGSW